MLCDAKNKPFYIGKGESGRIWQHEKDAHKKEGEIDKEVEKFKKKLDKNLTEKQKELQTQIFRKELEGNNKKIKKINSGKGVTKVIVKWGLTNDEAYMVESALINMYKFIGGKKNPLTNIANGHMSKKEKENRYCKTEAQKIEDFEKNCAQTEKHLTDILKVYFGEDYTDKNPKDDGCGILFVKINNLYPDCNGEPNKILDAASGFWKVEQELDKIEYVFALYQSQVVGIYPVNKDKKNWIQKNDLKKIDPDTGKAMAVLEETTKELQLPFALKDVVRKEEYIKIKNQIENGTLEKDKKGKYKMFFEATDLTGEQKKKLKKIKNLLGKYIIDVPGTLNPVSYNFDADGEFRKDTEEKKTTKKKN